MEVEVRWEWGVWRGWARGEMGGGVAQTSPPRLVHFDYSASCDFRQAHRASLDKRTVQLYTSVPCNLRQFKKAHRATLDKRTVLL